jgi:hypothetical protein
MGPLLSGSILQNLMVKLKEFFEGMYPTEYYVKACLICRAGLHLKIFGSILLKKMIDF